jgi:membrane-bound lytic murein transglycosylase B
LSQTLFALDYTKKAEVRQFIDKMHTKYKYKKSYLNKIFKQVRKDPIAPHKKSKPKKVKPLSQEYRPQGKWDIYSRMHMGHNQSVLGAEFMFEHYELFEKAQEKYGVPPEYIAAIIGIESYYGKNRGIYYVFDSLTHLAFDGNRRSKFYKYELQEFLRLCYREQLEPRAIKGSKSGAIGMAQFMPSNYKLLAVDFDHDGKIRLSKPADAIGSIANYLKKNGWEKDVPVGTRVSYEGNRFNSFKTGFTHKYHRKNLKNITPREYFDYEKKIMLIKLEREKYDELWYGTKNFYVITRYNHSDYYAMAVHQLAQKIKNQFIVKYEVEKEQKVHLAKSENKKKYTPTHGVSEELLTDEVPPLLQNHYSSNIQWDCRTNWYELQLQLPLYCQGHYSYNFEL